jgi:hypothetical protein
MTKVTVENVMRPGKTYRVDATSYEAMRKALLKALPRKSPGMTYDEMSTAVRKVLPQDVFPGGERAGWWLKCVQLDLEAKAIVVREKTRPLRWLRP